MKQDLHVDRLILRADHYASRARMFVRHNRTAEARLATNRAEQLLALVAQARLVRAVALLETTSTQS